MTFKKVMGFFGDPMLGKRPSEKATFYSNIPISHFILALKSLTGSKDKHAYPNRNLSLFKLPQRKMLSHRGISTLKALAEAWAKAEAANGGHSLAPRVCL